MAIISNRGGGTGNASFSQLNDHIAVAGNLSSQWNQSSEVITITAGTFTGNTITSATDTNFNSMQSGNIILRSGNAWVNGTISGSGNVSISTTGSAIVVTGTQLTISDGANISSSVNGNTVTISATNSDTLRSMTDTDISSITSGHILIWNGNDFQNRSVQGDVTISTNGFVTIGNKKVTLPKIDGGTSSGFLFTDASGNLTASSVTQGGGGSSFDRGDIFGGTNVTVANSGTEGVIINSKSDSAIVTLINNSISTTNITKTFSNGVITLSGSTGGSGGTSTLSGATDTDISSPVAGEILIWNGTDNLWVNYSANGAVSLSQNGTFALTNSSVTSNSISANAITSAKISANAVTLNKISGGGTVGFLATTSGNGTVGIGNINAGDNITITKSGADITISGQAAGGGSFARSNIIAGKGITTTNSGATSVQIDSNAGKTKRFIDFGNDTTTNIAAGDFVAGLEGEDGNGNFVGTKADEETKVPIGIADLAIAGKANNAADENVVKRSVFVVGSHDIPDGDIDGNFSGARDRQAVYLKWISDDSQWKVTLEKTQWRCGTHHNGDVIFDFVAMHSSQDVADQIVSTISAFSGDIDRTNDGVFMDDNGVGKNIDWDTFEAVVEPIHLKTGLSISGYTYESAAGNVTAGEFHLIASDLSNVSLRGVARAGDEEKFKAVMSLGFRLRMQNSTNTIFVEGIVGSINVQGSAIIATFVENSVEKSTANFSNDTQLTFISKGRHPEWRNVEFDRTAAPDHQTLASTGYVDDYVADKFADERVTGFTALASDGTLDTDKELKWSNTDTDFEFYLNDTSYNSLKKWFIVGYWMEFYLSTTYETLERCRISSVSARANNLISLGVDNQWIKNNAHQGASANVGIRFIGPRRHDIEQERRYGVQTATGNFGRGENIQRVADGSRSTATRFASTFTRGAGSASLGRFGPISANNNQSGGSLNTANYLVNNTQFAGMNNYLGFRARVGYNYIVTVALQGVFNFNNVSANETYGLEFGLNWRAFQAGTTPSGTWQTCEARDNSGVTGVTFRYQKFAIADNGGNVTQFGADPNHNTASSALAFNRGKFNPGAATNLDHGPTARYSFEVGGSPNASFVISRDTDFEFDPIYGCAEQSQGLANVYALNWDIRVVQEM